MRRAASLRVLGRMLACLGLGAASIALVAGPAQAAPTTTALEMTCVFGGETKFAYDTDVTITTQTNPSTDEIEVSADLSADMPNTAPAFVSMPASSHTGDLHTKVGGADLVLSASWVADFQGGTPIEIPTMTGVLAAGEDASSISVTGFEIAVGTIVIPCTVDGDGNGDGDGEGDAGATPALPVTVGGPAVTFEVPFKCAMPDFGANADFDYNATVEVTATPGVTLTAQLSDMPPVVPAAISLPGQAAQANLGLLIDGAAVKLTGSGTTDINVGGHKPVALPFDLTGSVTSTASELQVAVSSFDFNVGGVAGTCGVDKTPDTGDGGGDGGGGGGGGNDGGGKDKDKGKSKGTPATGTTTFKCVLVSLDSPFDYVADISISGMRAEQGDSTVSLAGDFSNLPGISPVEIPTGTNMDVTATLKVGGQDVELTGSSGVSAAPKAEVAVPRLTGSVDTDEDDLTVEMTGATFDFGTVNGLEIVLECEAGDGAKLSNLKVGVGDLDDSDSGNDSGGSPGTTGATTLPKTGGADSIPVIALWAAALAMLGAAVLMLTGRARDGVS